MSVLDRILFLSEELADDYADFEYDNFQKTKKPTRKACNRFTERHGALENLGKGVKALKARISAIQTQINKKKNTGEDLSRLHKELEDVNRKLKHLENKKDRMLMPKMTIQECLKNYDNFLNEGFGEKIKGGIRNIGQAIGTGLAPLKNKIKKLFMALGLVAILSNPQQLKAFDEAIDVPESTVEVINMYFDEEKTLDEATIDDLQKSLYNFVWNDLTNKYQLSEGESSSLYIFAIQKGCEGVSRMINYLSNKYDASGIEGERLEEFFNDYLYAYDALKGKIEKDLEKKAIAMKAGRK